MHDSNLSPHRIAVAISMALFFHALILVVISQLPAAPEQRSVILMTLALPPSPSQIASSANAAQTDPNQPQVITSSQESPLVFHIPDTLPTSPTLRSPSSDTSWIGRWFSGDAPAPPQPKPTPPAPQPQAPVQAQDGTETATVKSQNHPALSPYHQLLLKTLARNQYHDKQYSFERLTEVRSVKMSLRLHETGALLRVNIERSSGDDELDAAAQRSAFAASPFPPPPREDGSTNYTYPIDIQYHPRQLGER
jgi:TonB family protein